MISLLATLTLWAVHDTPFDRYERFMLARPVIHVSVAASKSGVAELGEGRMLVERGVGQRFDFAWGRDDYTFLQSDEGIMAIERTLRAYRKRPPYHIFQVPPPELAPLAQEGFPTIFIVSRVEHLLPQGTWGVARQETLGGRQLNVLAGSADSGQERLEFEVWLDESGRPWRQLNRMTAGFMSETVIIDIVEYLPVPPAEERDFALEIPLGFISLAAPIIADPLQIGQEAIWPKVLDSGGQTVDLAQRYRGKRVVLAFLGNDCPATEAWSREATRFSEALSRFNCEIVEIRYGAISGGESGRNVYWDPERTSWKDYRVPGTPFFVAIGEEGIVDRLYLGFDKGNTGRWLEVLTRTWSGR